LHLNENEQIKKMKFTSMKWILFDPINDWLRKRKKEKKKIALDKISKKY